VKNNNNLNVRTKHTKISSIISNASKSSALKSEIYNEFNKSQNLKLSGILMDPVNSPDKKRIEKIKSFESNKKT